MVAPVGGHAGDEFRREATRYRLDGEWVAVAGETRRTVVTWDPGGGVATTLSEPGSLLSGNEWHEIAAAVERLWPADALVIAGRTMTTQSLWTLAFDHRNSLRRSFFGITGEPTAADHHHARVAKALIFDGIVQAIEIGIPSGQPAVLVDEEYGADVIARARSPGIPTGVPVEASGNALLQFEHGDDGFGAVLERVDPTYAKVLVRYNPDDDPNDNRLQRVRLAMLQRWVQDHGRQWMLELLVPATPEQMNRCGGDAEVGGGEPTNHYGRNQIVPHTTASRRA